MNNSHANVRRMGDVGGMLVDRLVKSGVLASAIADWCEHTGRPANECVAFLATPDRASVFDDLAGLRVTLTGGAVLFCTAVELVELVTAVAADAARVVETRAQSRTAAVVGVLFGTIVVVRVVELSKGGG